MIQIRNHTVFLILILLGAFGLTVIPVGDYTDSLYGVCEDMGDTGENEESEEKEETRNGEEFVFISIQHFHLEESVKVQWRVLLKEPTRVSNDVLTPPPEQG
ncbi:hypothetical protein ACFLR1_01700 [Bacteroidota bacterium]